MSTAEGYLATRTLYPVARNLHPIPYHPAKKGGPLTPWQKNFAT